MDMGKGSDPGGPAAGGNRRGKAAKFSTRREEARAGG